MLVRRTYHFKVSDMRIFCLKLPGKPTNLLGRLGGM
jgi:hypothetical protein